MNIPRQDSVFPLTDSYIELDFNVTSNKSNHDDSVNADDIRLINLAPILLLNENKLFTSNGKHQERFDSAHVVCLMYKISPSRKDRNDLSTGLDENNERRKDGKKIQLLMKLQTGVSFMLGFFIKTFPDMLSIKRVVLTV